jgi:transposase
MRIIGCDYHPSWQQVCWAETTTGETGEVKLEHASGEATRFYQQLPEHAANSAGRRNTCLEFTRRSLES